MTTLLESGARPYRTKSGVITAVVLHGVLITAAIVGTAKVVLPPPEKVEQHAILYVAPPPPAPLPVPPPPLPKVHIAPKPKAAPTPAPRLAIKRAPAPTPPRPKLAAVKTPTLTPAAPKIDAPAAPVVAAVAPPVATPPVVTNSGGDVAEPSSSSKEKSGEGKAEPAPAPPATGHSDGSAFTGEQVEREVRPLPGAPKPIYPSQLRDAGVTGRVLMRFVVGTDGRVESGSFEVIDSPNNAFSDAVRRAIMATRFQPAEVGGHAVRQLVEQSFTFAIQ